MIIIGLIDLEVRLISIGLNMCYVAFFSARNNVFISIGMKIMDSQFIDLHLLAGEFVLVFVRYTIIAVGVSIIVQRCECQQRD